MVPTPSLQKFSQRNRKKRLRLEPITDPVVLHKMKLYIVKDGGREINRNQSNVRIFQAESILFSAVVMFCIMKSDKRGNNSQ
ncbi:hypothetical protein AB6A40_008973 [Gnathostoma spinigerum]|uniref:Uncharacterized protein n=1 Tax=Gnathostoma spinigerum TaxID=75299 RepID=A0ABD6EYD5_9BILA